MFGPNFADPARNQNASITLFCRLMHYTSSDVFEADICVLALSNKPETAPNSLTLYSACSDEDGEAETYKIFMTVSQYSLCKQRWFTTILHW